MLRTHGLLSPRKSQGTLTQTFSQSMPDFSFVYETRSHFTAQAGLGLEQSFSQPSKCLRSPPEPPSQAGVSAWNQTYIFINGYILLQLYLLISMCSLHTWVWNPIFIHVKSVIWAHSPLTTLSSCSPTPANLLFFNSPSLLPRCLILIYMWKYIGVTENHSVSETEHCSYRCGCFL